MIITLQYMPILTRSKRSSQKKRKICFFHLHFPRFLIYLPKSQVLANTHIPKPSLQNADECPPVYYMSTLVCFFIMIWLFWVTYPSMDILLHVDNIDATFCHSPLFTGDGNLVPHCTHWSSLWIMLGTIIFQSPI
jgi:hypothetical protein